MKKNWMISGALGLVAAILYFSSMATYAYPGIGANLMVCWRGLDYTSVPAFPFMAIFAKALGAGNLIAPICGVCAVMMFFHIVAAYVGWCIRGRNIIDRKNELSRIAAISATIIFMLTPSVRAAATHLEPRLFEFTWALAIVAIALPFFRNTKLPTLLLALVMGVMTALGMCDSIIFGLFAPAYLVLIAYVALARERKPYLAMLLYLIVFFVVLLVALNCFGLEFKEFLKAMSVELHRYVSVPGWLFVFIFATIPFIISIFSCYRSYNEMVGLVQWIFHCAMSFVAILAMATPLAPSSLMEPFGVLPVVTSAYVAAVAGYLLAYWWLLRINVVSMIAGGILLFVMVVSSIWNLFTFDGDNGIFADKVAKKILSDMGDRHWLVTGCELDRDIKLDSHLKLAAADEGKQIHIISILREDDEEYLARVGDIVTEENVGGSKNGQLRLSLSLGVMPFLQDWFEADPTAAKDVAILGVPDLWYSANVTPVPEFFFFGADPKRTLDWNKDWHEFNEILEAPKNWGSYHNRTESNPSKRMRLALRRHLGFVANNRGVWLQDQKRDDEAFAMYEMVLNEIDRDNICALLNEISMAGAKYSAAMARQRELDRLLKSAADDTNRRYILWQLGTYYGYLRNPDVYMRNGNMWAKSGRPRDALNQIRRAMDFVPTDKRSVLLNMMAALYASENEQKKSRELYEEILAKNEKDHNALIGLMRLELLRGDTAKALDYLQRASRVAPDARSGKLEAAMALMMKDNQAGAREIIKKLTDANSNDMQAWSMLATVVIQQINSTKDKRVKEKLQKELEQQIIPAMERASGDSHDYFLHATKGFVMMNKGVEKRKEARDAFLQATKTRPDVATTRDLVLGLDIQLNDKESAAIHAKDVLRRNRNAPLANYIMGSLALEKGQLSEAESYLSKAADAPQPIFMALNDMAETLRRQKRYAEAESYARKAVEVAPNRFVVYETLGSVLMDANKNLDEAESCIRKACELSKAKDGVEADVRMLISLARVQLRNNDKKNAKITIRKIQSRIGELSDFERQEFESVKKNAR